MLHIFNAPELIGIHIASQICSQVNSDKNAPILWVQKQKLIDFMFSFERAKILTKGELQCINSPGQSMSN